MDPANRSASAMTLSCVEQNDPDLTNLKVSNTGHFTRDGMGNYWPNDSADLASLCDAIGANTNLQKLDIRSARELVDMAANNGAFSKGLKRNASINELWLENCDLSTGMGREILSGFVANNSNLTRIVLNQCALGILGNRGAAILASAVTSCPNLNWVRLSSCNVDDDILVEFVSGISGGHQLCSIYLSWNTFGRAGCEALATLLQDPNGSLTYLDLGSNNRIDDNCATILANSLKGNSKSKNINLSGSNAITGSGWDAFSKVLCDTSSVNVTYLSNHTLMDLGNVVSQNKLSSLLELNRGVDKKQVAIRKILRHHTHLDMEPFLEWDLKVLPLAVSWFDRARDYVQNDESTIDTRKLSAIYQFATALPMMFVPPPHKRQSIKDR